MIETVFTIFLAGCGHDLGTCGPLETYQVSVADQAACELLLDQRLGEVRADWPVILGSCESGGTQPAWYPELVLADAG